MLMPRARATPSRTSWSPPSVRSGTPTRPGWCSASASCWSPFPLAHGVILTALYLPVALMLVGLILRGVAFEFRVKARGWHRERVEPAVLRGLADRRARAGLHARRAASRASPTGLGVHGSSRCWSGCGLAGGYALLGATWLILKTEGDLQRSARCAGRAARCCLPRSASPACRSRRRSPSTRIFDKWFALAEHRCCSRRCRSPPPRLFVGIWRCVSRLRARRDGASGCPFVLGVWVFVLAFAGWPTACSRTS